MNAPVPLLYDNVPPPDAAAVVVDKSVNAIPPASVSFTQALPFYFKTCHELADVIVTSVKPFNVDEPPDCATQA